MSITWVAWPCTLSKFLWSFFALLNPSTVWLQQSSSSHSSSSSSAKSSERAHKHQTKKRSPSASPPHPVQKHNNVQGTDNVTKQNKNDDSGKSHKDLAGTISTNENVKFNQISRNLGSSQARRFGRSSVSLLVFYIATPRAPPPAAVNQKKAHPICDLHSR